MNQKTKNVYQTPKSKKVSGKKKSDMTESETSPYINYETPAIALSTPNTGRLVGTAEKSFENLYIGNNKVGTPMITKKISRKWDEPLRLNSNQTRVRNIDSGRNKSYMYVVTKKSNFNIHITDNVTATPVSLQRRDTTGLQITDARQSTNGKAEQVSVLTNDFSKIGYSFSGDQPLAAQQCFGLRDVRVMTVRLNAFTSKLPSFPMHLQKLVLDVEFKRNLYDYPETLLTYFPDSLTEVKIDRSYEWPLPQNFLANVLKKPDIKVQIYDTNSTEGILYQSRENFIKLIQYYYHHSDYNRESMSQTDDRNKTMTKLSRMYFGWNLTIDDSQFMPLTLTYYSKLDTRFIDYHMISMIPVGRVVIQQDTQRIEKFNGAVKSALFEKSSTDFNPLTFLPRDLESLEIRCPLFDHKIPEHLSTLKKITLDLDSHYKHSILNKLPNLKVLKISTPNKVERNSTICTIRKTPESCDISCYTFLYVFGEDLENLRYLRIHANHFRRGIDIPQFLPNLQSLHLSGHTYLDDFSVKKYNNLQNLSIDFDNFNQALPELDSLLFLYVRAKNFDRYIDMGMYPRCRSVTIVSPVFNQKLELRQRHLINLYIQSDAFQKDIDLFSNIELKKFTIVSKKFRNAINNIPKSLDEFKLHTDEYIFKSLFLPPSLKKLYLGCLSFRPGDSVIFPTRCKTIEIYEREIVRPLDILKGAPNKVDVIHIISEEYSCQDKVIPENIFSDIDNLWFSTKKMNYTPRLFKPNLKFGLNVDRLTHFPVFSCPVLDLETNQSMCIFDSIFIFCQALPALNFLDIHVGCRAFTLSYCYLYSETYDGEVSESAPREKQRETNEVLGSHFYEQLTINNGTNFDINSEPILEYLHVSTTCSLNKIFYIDNENEIRNPFFTNV